MARQFKRDAEGRFASTGTSKGAAPIKAAATSKPKRVTTKRVAAGVAGVAAIGATAGVLKVRHDALARYAARTAAAQLRRSDATSSW